jgi:hypothetical protein
VSAGEPSDGALPSVAEGESEDPASVSGPPSGEVVVASVPLESTPPVSAWTWASVTEASGWLASAALAPSAALTPSGMPPESEAWEVGVLCAPQALAVMTKSAA